MAQQHMQVGDLALSAGRQCFLHENGANRRHTGNACWLQSALMLMWTPAGTLPDAASAQQIAAELQQEVAARKLQVQGAVVVGCLCPWPELTVGISP